MMILCGIHICSHEIAVTFAPELEIKRLDAALNIERPASHLVNN